MFEAILRLTFLLTIGLALQTVLPWEWLLVILIAAGYGTLALEPLRCRQLIRKHLRKCNYTALAIKERAVFGNPERMTLPPRLSFEAVFKDQSGNEHTAHYDVTGNFMFLLNAKVHGA